MAQIICVGSKLSPPIHLCTISPQWVSTHSRVMIPLAKKFLTKKYKFKVRNNKMLFKRNDKHN